MPKYYEGILFSMQESKIFILGAFDEKDEKNEFIL